MKYQITAKHKDIFNQLFDYTLKSVGINGIPAVSNLVTIVNIIDPTPVAILELDENQLKTLNSMSDVSLKYHGLVALGTVMELNNILNNPLPEEKEEEKPKK